MQLIKKLGSRVIRRYRFEICNQISHIDNPFFVILRQIFHYFINKFIPDGRTKIPKKPTKVTVNISNLFNYSLMAMLMETMGVYDNLQEVTTFPTFL